MFAVIVRVEVEPALLAWARERARIDHERLVTKFPKLPVREAGDLQPTIKQLENYAEATHTSLGFLLLDQPHERVANFVASSRSRTQVPR